MIQSISWTPRLCSMGALAATLEAPPTPTDAVSLSRHPHQPGRPHPPHARREKIDFETVPNTRTAAMLPIMDAGVQVAFATAFAAVQGGATAATISVLGHLAHHRVEMTYRLDGDGLHGDGTLGGTRVHDRIASGTGPQSGGVVLDSRVGSAAGSGEGSMDDQGIMRIHGQVGRVGAELTISGGADPESMQIRGRLNQSQFVEDLHVQSDEHETLIIASGHIGHRKLEREYSIRPTTDGIVIDGSGRLGRGNPTDLHIEVHVEA